MWIIAKAAVSAAMLAALAACATAPADEARNGEAAPPFIGHWRQAQAECPGAMPVAELIFQAQGRFSVTWTPFETYQDYWGSWTYNSSSETLTLTVEHGNYIPSDVVPAGRVRVENDALTFEALSLGSPRPQAGPRCEAPFRRV